MDDTGWFVVTDGAVTVQIAARPGSSRRGFVRIDPRGLVVALHSPPEKGRANAELIELLAEGLHLPRSTIAVIRGASGRRKTVRIKSAAPDAVIKALASVVAAR